MHTARIRAINPPHHSFQRLIRRAGWHIVTLMAVVLAGCGTAGEIVRELPDLPGPDPTPASSIMVSAYHPWWTQGTWRDLTPSAYDEIFFFSIDVDSTGSIADRHGWPDRWFDMQRTLSNEGVRVTPVVTLFNQAAFEALFRTASSSSQLRETIRSLVQDSPLVGGIQIDFEIFRPVPAEVRSNFTSFMRTLRSDLDAARPDLRLSAFVVAYDESDVYDEPALADIVDYLVIQGYDLHGRREGRTGPVAGLEGWGNRNWKTIVNRLTDLGVPRAKIVMSVPYFGYEWPAVSDEPGARTTGPGYTVSYAPLDSAVVSSPPPSAMQRAEKHGLRRDPASGSPYYAYQDTSGWRQGWFEDAESLEEKYEYVRQAGLRGVAIFPAAYGTDALERTLMQTLKDRDRAGASR